MCLWSRITLLLHINMLANRWIYDVVWYSVRLTRICQENAVKKRKGEKGGRGKKSKRVPGAINNTHHAFGFCFDDICLAYDILCCRKLTQLVLQEHWRLYHWQKALF